VSPCGLRKRETIIHRYPPRRPFATATSAVQHIEGLAGEGPVHSADSDGASSEPKDPSRKTCRSG
jgi:hypothetical protein